MNLYNIETESRRLTVTPTFSGRITRAVERLLIAWPLVFLALAVFLLPDFVGRYREAEPVQGLFWATLAAVALFVSMLLAILRIWRKETWHFDSEQRLLLYETSSPFGFSQQQDVPLREVLELVHVKQPFGKRSAILVNLKNGHREIVCSSRWNPDEIASIAASLTEFFKHNRFDVRFIETADVEYE